MNLNNSYIIGAEFKELKRSDASQHFFAEVVLIDRTPPGSEPSLYQLKKEHLSEEEGILALKHGILTLQNDPMIMMGEVSSLDRKHRQVVLANGDVITYKYLIINTGMRQDNEYAAALHTLFHALLLSKKVPSIIPNLQPKSDEATFQIRSPLPPLSPEIMEKIVRKNLTESDLQSPTNLITTIKKLSEVQM